MLHFDTFWYELTDGFRENLAQTLINNLVTECTSQPEENGEYELDLDGSDIELTSVLVELSSDYEGHLH